MLIQRLFAAAIMTMVCLAFSSDLMAQRGGMSSKLQLLGNQEVQEELGLVDDQREGLRDLESKSRDIMREVFSGMREKFNDVSREERNEMMNDLRSKIREKMEGVTEELGDVLLPHQVERLDQITLQMQIRQRGIVGAVQSGEMQEVLGLDDEDAEKMKEKEEEVKKSLEEKIAKLREEARDEVLSVLPAEKQAQIKEMLGETFQMSDRRQQRGGGGRGGAGGGGGQRGGGGGGQRGGGRGGRDGGDGGRDM